MTDETKKTLLKATLVGAAAAVVANLALYFVWNAAVGPFMVAENPDSTTLAPLKLGFVVISSIVPAFAAGGALALILRFNRPQALSIFMSLALLVLVLSMLPVAKVPTDGLGTQLGLALLHLVAALCITLPLVRAAKAVPAQAGSPA
jgi:peptidoglycan/LPS O-acetylase OafA/YrhL